jgi:hypothetical protein
MNIKFTFNPLIKRYCGWQFYCTGTSLNSPQFCLSNSEKLHTELIEKISFDIKINILLQP